MRTLTHAVLTTAALAGLAATTAPAVAAAAETVTERGIVLECTGEHAGLGAYVTLYENDVYTNYVQVVLDDNPKRAASREPGDIWSEGEIRTGVTIAGQRARIKGSARKVGDRTEVHEEVDDAGYHVVSDGWHRRLAHDLVLTYDGTRVPLTCAPAFYYKLEVTKTPL